MKKIFSILAIAALMAGCSKEDSTTDVAPATFTLTGYTSNDTRTAFGEPDWDNNKIPFIWSEGDKIWSGSEQSTEATINNDGSASFSFASEPATTIYYNMKGSSATEANVPAEQSIANNLGENGDFGYATVEDGTFTLNHATAYLWFNTTTTIDNATLKTITINADGVNIAGKATWSGSSFGAVGEGKSEVTLTVNQPLSSTNGNVWAMVVLPADLSGKSVKVIYELTVDGVTKYYAQTLSGKGLPAGTTQKISANITEAELTTYRELRVLTFEDGTEKFSPYSFKTSYETTERTYDISKWSDLIPIENYGDEMIYGIYDINQFMYCGDAGYYWVDANNTYLKHKFSQYTNWASSSVTSYQGGGEALSNSYAPRLTSGTEDQYSSTGYGQYDHERYVYAPSPTSGTNTFCVHHGYSDFYNTKDNLSGFEFSDGIARVIDHMYIANTSYVYYQLKTGFNFGVNYTGPTDNTWYKIVAYGYESDSDETPSTTEFYLLKNNNFVEDWTKWDLTPLGKVVRVEFNMFGSPDNLLELYPNHTEIPSDINDITGQFGLAAPAYFAYDNIAVQF